MLVTKRVEQTVTTDVVTDVLCNRCGKSCVTGQPFQGRVGNADGLIEVSVSGSYDSNVIGDLVSWTFSLCEVCLGEIVHGFKLPVRASHMVNGDAEPPSNGG